MPCQAGNLNLYQRFTNAIVHRTETSFYNLGIYIGNKPYKTIILCWILVFVSALGFVRFRQEKNPLKLWVPPYTSFIRDSEWLMKKFQLGTRPQNVLIHGEDVLVPEVFQSLYELREDVLKLRSEENGYQFKDVCFMIPRVDKKMMAFFEGRKPNTTELDPSMTTHPALYCSIIEAMKAECYEHSLLELFDYNKTLIYSLTKKDILKTLNEFDKNSLYGRIKNFEVLLGQVERDKNGSIIKAKGITNAWMVKVNYTAVDMEKVGNMAGTADWSSEEAYEWEGAYLELLKNFSVDNFTVTYEAARSFGDISGSSLFRDMDKLFLGVLIMIIYVQLIISKYNWVEARILLGFCGLGTIAMAFISGCGICSLLGVYYGPVHTSLPFLLMGLGIDDMLVIIACWNDLPPETKKLPLPERIGLMLKHGGVSITVTSFTDVIAFAIGASTILPCLESFCIYAGTCVAMIFIFAVTFFTACFVIDETRLENSRNGAIPCIVHEDYKPNSCSQKNYTNLVFYTVYKNFLLTTPGKIIIVAGAIISLGFSIESTLKLEQRFDPTWFIPKDTYLHDYMEDRHTFFPSLGLDGGLFIGSLNYSKEFKNIKILSDELKASEFTDNIASWVDSFHEFVLHNFKQDLYKEEVSEELFHTALSKFLFSPRYAVFRKNFQFKEELECGAPVPKIEVSSITFNFRILSEPSVYIPAMHKVRSIAEKANFTTGDKFATVWCVIFATWITDEVIDIEVERNLELALICVMGCTILLIADWQICLWIFICVLMTMINVCGFMQRWGLTIDLVSCIGLELAIGLCVDYATHIGHTFLTIADGTRTERTLKTVTSIGSAVLYGGLSTFIGVFMLSQSNAYTFQAFFKIFLLVIVFGLFHGILFLPVVLSWIGPKPYTKHNPISQSEVELE